ncbi:TlpA family protein disulfide reductase [Roseivirga sp.]|uniref:TlpA family protein disulfide reductase n=1 Tax=Roseivirga sp. TaxID=1964215 RepID=UPI003B8BF26E
MKRVYIHFLLLPLILLGCNNKESQEVLKTEKALPDQIVLIFNEPVQNGFYTFSNGSSAGRTRSGDEVQYIDDQYIYRKLKIDFNKKSDTVILKSKRKWVEVTLMYKGVDDLTYIFKNGDTTVFNYNGPKPIAKLINREEPYSTTNFSLYLRDSIASNEYLSSDILGQPMLLWSKYDSIEDFKARDQAILSLAAKDFERDVDQEIAWLDSLLKTNKMTQTQYDMHLRSLYARMGTLKSSFSFLPEDFKSSLVNSALKKLQNKSPKLLQRADSLLYIKDYSGNLSSNTVSSYRNSIPMMSQQTKGGGGSTRDYRLLYDSLRVRNDLSASEKKLLQYNNMKSILSQPTFFNIESRLKYLTRFRNDFQDTILVNDLMSQFDIEFKIDDEIQVESIDGKSSTLKDLIAGQNGKTVYIDFWASWCAPCIREMPASKTMTNQYEDQPLVFVYLSTDRRASDWRRSIEKNNLKTGLHYRVTNANNSKGLEDLNIPFIPRYMIYDQQGRLVNNDAPRPSETDLIATEFAKYLSDEK